MGHARPIEDLLLESLRPHGPMLSVCPVEGCTTLTMGGTCVEHDLPVTVTYERGRPFAATTPATAEGAPVPS